MIYLLGGPPRVGKSIIAREIQQICAVSVVSTDTLAAVLETVLRPEEAPDLFVFSKFNEMAISERLKIITEKPTTQIDYVRKESRVVWKAVESFIRRENVEGRDVLIEGVAVLPALVMQIEDIPHQVVFIGNQSENHKENMMKSARENKHDWLRNVSEEYIRAYAQCVNRMSAYIEREAEKFGFKYLDMGEEISWKGTEDVMRAFGLSAC
jgi:2-phosphoglycerate kinase